MWSHLRPAAVTLALACGVLLGACAPVRPWQRSRLASAVMALPLAEPPLAVGYRAKLLESRVGGGLPGVAAGGGCGCTQ
jgi:Domain of unknown function (DUF4266)